MSAAERRKGVVFENEICGILRDKLGGVVHRNLAQSRGGEIEGGDIVVAKYTIECKRRARIGVHAWLEQARADADAGQVPVVVARGDGKRPLAILDLDELLALIQGEL
jgi:hypothetical protein